MARIWRWGMHRTTRNDWWCKHQYSVHFLSKKSCLSRLACAAVGIGRSDSRTYNVDYCAERYSTLFLLAGELPHSIGCVCKDTKYLFSIPFWNIILNVAWKETSIVLCFGIMLPAVNFFRLLDAATNLFQHNTYSLSLLSKNEDSR